MISLPSAVSDQNQNIPAVIGPALTPEMTQQMQAIMSTDPMMALQYLGLGPGNLAKGEREKEKDDLIGLAGPNANVNELRGFGEVNPSWYSMKNVREQLPKISFRMCREVRRKNPVIAAITNTRKRQARPFGYPSHDLDKPGYQIILRDREAVPTKDEKEELKYLTEWFYYTGRTDFKDWEEREDTLVSAQDKLIEDYLTIDQVAAEIRRDKSGNAVDFWTWDGATFKRVNRGGFYGSQKDIDPRSNMTWESATQKIVEAKMELIPNLEDIRYIQEINGRFVAAFTMQDLVFDIMNRRTDVDFSSVGFSLTEQSIQLITAFMFSMAYNIEQFNTGTLPKVALAFKNGNFGEQQLMRFQDQWIANFRGIYGAWRIPMLNGDVQPIDLYKNNRDMEFNQFMQFTTSLQCAVYGIDGAEMGLRLNQAQNVLSENADAKMKFSKDRGLHDMLGQITHFFNVMMRRLNQVKTLAPNTGSKNRKYQHVDGVWRKFQFTHTGLSPTDLAAQMERDVNAVQYYLTINELRAQKDMQKIEGGDIIMNTIYTQAQQMAQQGQEQQGGAAEPEGGEDDGQDLWDDPDMDKMLDQATDELSKATTLLM